MNSHLPAYTGGDDLALVISQSVAEAAKPRRYTEERIRRKRVREAQQFPRRDPKVVVERLRRATRNRELCLLAASVIEELAGGYSRGILLMQDKGDLA